MDSLFNGRLRYLFFVPVFLLIGFVLYYQYAFREIDRVIFEEKLLGKQIQMDQAAADINTFAGWDKDWGADDYVSAAKAVISRMDSGPDAFAALYDSQLRLISESVSPDSEQRFDAQGSPEFKSAVMAGSSGSLQVVFKNGGKETNMHLYFRWIPEDASYADRCLAVAGAADQSAASDSGNRLAVGIVIQILLTFLVYIIFVALLYSLAGRHIGPDRMGYAAQRGRRQP